jgi:hypothetical protein
MTGTRSAEVPGMRSDHEALSWAADLAERGVHLVDGDGEPLPTAALAWAHAVVQGEEPGTLAAGEVFVRIGRPVTL